MSNDPEFPNRYHQSGPAPHYPAPQPGPAQHYDPAQYAYSPSEWEERQAARKRIQDRRDLVTHAVVYGVVNLFLVGIWYWTVGPNGYFWPAWVLGGWGIGLALHAWSALFTKPITEADVDRELGRGR